MTIIYALIAFYGTEEATICGLFSTRELAEDAQTDSPYSEIQEHYLNPFTEHPPGQQFWCVEVILGNISKCYTTKPGWGLRPKRDYPRNYKGDRIDHTYWTYCWATDEEHAKEIALEPHEDKWT
jgi:hypothetical protein